MTLKINDLSEEEKLDAKWKKLNCNCDIDPDCKACQFKKAEESIPKDEFTVSEYDDEGNKIGNKTITEIKIVRGKYDDVMGWTF